MIDGILARGKLMENAEMNGDRAEANCVNCGYPDF